MFKLRIIFKNGFRRISTIIFDIITCSNYYTLTFLQTIYIDRPIVVVVTFSNVYRSRNIISVNSISRYRKYR